MAGPAPLLELKKETQKRKYKRNDKNPKKKIKNKRKLPKK